MTSAIIGFASPPEWGLVGAVVASILGFAAWGLRAMRSDMRALHRADRAELVESRREFIHHLTTTGERQTEAILASSVATQQSVQALRDMSALINRHDEKAHQRYENAESAADARTREIIDHIDRSREMRT
jgi:hypothetical protein